MQKQTSLLTGPDHADEMIVMHENPAWPIVPFPSISIGVGCNQIFQMKYATGIFLSMKNLSNCYIV